MKKPSSAALALLTAGFCSVAALTGIALANALHRAMAHYWAVFR